MKNVQLYSYADNKNYSISIDENIDIDSDDFDWEEILLNPLLESGENINTENGVSWGWEGKPFN